MSEFGTNRTNPACLTMSGDRDRPEMKGARQTVAIDPEPTSANRTAWGCWEVVCELMRAQRWRGALRPSSTKAAGALAPPRSPPSASTLPNAGEGNKPPRCILWLNVS
jgi:hypothetical protein